MASEDDKSQLCAVFSRFGFLYWHYLHLRLWSCADIYLLGVNVLFLGRNLVYYLTTLLEYRVTSSCRVCIGNVKFAPLRRLYTILRHFPFWVGNRAGREANGPSIGQFIGEWHTTASARAVPHDAHIVKILHNGDKIVCCTEAGAVG